MKIHAPSGLKDIQIQYFALLREERGCDHELMKTEAETPVQLYEELQAKFGFSIPFKNLRVAINEEFEGENTVLKTGDTVVFIPPVAGG